MTNSFGGFSGNPDIENFLASIETSFVNMVISNSIILKSYQGKAQEVLSIATKQVYPRIGLRLAAAKDKDNSPLFAASPFSQSQFASSGYDLNRINLFENVLRLMTNEYSPLSQGITNVAASLTAAILIKSIPINGDIKNIDLGEGIEKRAFEDLDRIVEIYSVDKSINDDDTDTKKLEETQQSIYVSLDIDKTTLPANWFNVGKLNEEINIDQSQPNANVRTLDSLSIPSDKLAFGWYFVSGTEFESIPENVPNETIVPELTIYPPVEGAFLVKDGYTQDDIISVLADYINDAGLERDTNVIVSPNNGDLITEDTHLAKKKLYLNEADKSYDKKIASFKLQHRINSLTFDSRRKSSVVNRELIIIRFFTLDKVILAQQKLKENSEFDQTLFTYIGDWQDDLVYSKGDLVNIGSYIYIAKDTTIDNYPLQSPDFWFLLYSDTEDLVLYKSFASDYIDGLVYGLNNSYTLLDKKGPKSVLLSVKDGDLKVINARSSLAGERNSVIDTFYFRLAEGVTSVSGTLKIRVASTKLSDVPDIFSFLNPFDQTLDVVLENASAEDVALAVLKAIHLIGQYTDVLSGLVFPYALQFTAFKRTNNEVKEVIDILQVPDGLEVATGTSEVEKTPYKNKPRSLIIIAVPMPNAVRAQAQAEEDMNGVNALSATKFKTNSLLQYAKDRINFLDTSGRLNRYANQ